MSKFPAYPGASFSEADVEIYLEELSKKGWEVYKHRNEYILAIDDKTRITIWHNHRDNEWTVDASYQPEKIPFSTNPTANFQQLKEDIANAAEYLGQHIENGPKKIRLQADTPVSNKSSIARLAGGNTVESVFDSYFDDKAIDTLVTLSNLGMSLSNNVRILTNAKMKARLSSPLVQNFQTEKGVCLNIRLCSNAEHRRYMLLSSGESIIIGCSLNSLDKNEAAHIEESQDDRDFFEAQWKISAPL